MTALIVLLLVGAVGEAHSHRLSALTTNPREVAAFWQERAGRGPLVEELRDAPEQLLVTFLWRGDAATRRVEVRGGPVESSRTGFEQAPGTDIWHLSLRLPRDSRVLYNFVVQSATAVDGTERLVETYPIDPLNPVEFDGGSVLELPQAPAADWHRLRPDAPHGKVEDAAIESAALGERRRLRVYRPATRADQPPVTNLAIFLDGEEAERLLNVPTVLDNLIAAEKIPPTISILVLSQGERGRDLLFSDRFGQFLARELVPWAEQTSGVRFAPAHTLISGVSLGGLTSVFAAAEHPEVFGNVLSQSGAFWRTRPDRSPLPEGWLPGHLARPGELPVRFYLEVGRFEPPSMVDNNRRLRDVLRTKGCSVAYEEDHAGHDYLHWRASLPRGLSELLGPDQTR